MKGGGGRIEGCFPQVEYILPSNLTPNVHSFFFVAQHHLLYSVKLVSAVDADLIIHF